MTRDDLLTLVRRILSPIGLSGSERRDLLVRLEQAAPGMGIVERLFRYDVLLTADEIVDLVLASQSARLRVPSRN